jgi:putative membrane protein
MCAGLAPFASSPYSRFATGEKIHAHASALDNQRAGGMDYLAPVPGFYVNGAAAALIAAVVIGLVNATIGLVLKIITFPLTILTLGLFWLVINGIMLELASAVVPGFHITSFAAAFWGAIVLAIVNMLLKWLVMPERQ